VIQQHYLSLGFSAARLQLNGMVYREWEPQVAGPEYWIIRIPFSENGFIELARDFRTEGVHSTVAPLAYLLHRVLAERVEGKPSQCSPLAARVS
jgi:hypothetical protein